MAVELEFVDDNLLVLDLISVQALDKGFFGNDYQGKKTQLILMPSSSSSIIDIKSS